MKGFEQIINKNTCSSLPDTLEPLQFAYRAKWSTDDTFALAVHTSAICWTFIYLGRSTENNFSFTTKTWNLESTYVRILIIDYSSALDTVIPSKLVSKQLHLQLDRRLPHQHALSAEYRQSPLFHMCPWYWYTSGTCPRPTPVLSVRSWLQRQAQLQHHSEVCWGHHHPRHHRQEWQVHLQTGGDITDQLV